MPSGCLCYGKGDYKYNDSGEVLFSLDSIYHDKPVQIVQAQNGKLEYEISKLDNHNDDELRALEKMCEREVPFEAFLKAQKSKVPINASVLRRFGLRSA